MDFLQKFDDPWRDDSYESPQLEMEQQHDAHEQMTVGQSTPTEGTAQRSFAELPAINALFSIWKTSNVTMLPISAGIVPVSWLLNALNSLRIVNSPNSVGNVPRSTFSETRRYRMVVSEPRKVGKVPVILLPLSSTESMAFIPFIKDKSPERLALLAENAVRAVSEPNTFGMVE